MNLLLKGEIIIVQSRDKVGDQTPLEKKVQDVVVAGSGQIVAWAEVRGKLVGLIVR